MHEQIVFDKVDGSIDKYLLDTDIEEFTLDEPKQLILKPEKKDFE